MPHRYPAEVRFQVIELARSGTNVAQLAETFGMSDATIYNWLKQERVDLCSRQRAISQRRRGDMQRATLLAFIGQIERYALLQRLEKLVQGVAGGKAAR